MKKELLFVLLLFSFITNAQQKMTFSYDAAGNQKTRTLCINCPVNSAKSGKEIEDLTEQDLEKISDKGLISYYPNPVKEELYLQWELTKENNVASIQVISTTGQLLKQYQTGTHTNNQNIPFQNYPGGVYVVLLKYHNGDEKSIKIIKQ